MKIKVGDTPNCSYTEQAVFYRFSLLLTKFSTDYVGNLFTNVGLQLFGFLGGSHEREIKQTSMNSHKRPDWGIKNITTGTLVVVVTNTTKWLTLKVLPKRQFPELIKKNLKNLPTL